LPACSVAAVAAPDQVGAFLADHDRGCVGVAADQRGHDRCVGYAQPVDAAHAQLVVDNGHRVVGQAHLAGADRVVLGIGAGIYGWDVKIYDQYSILISLLSLIPAGLALWLIFKYLDRIPDDPFTNSPPPPPTFRGE